MGSISAFLENELLDHIFNAAYVPPATLYLGLSTADPLNDGSGLAEPVGGSYNRTAISFNAAASRQIVQAGAVTFPQATGDWGLITHFGVFDNQTPGAGNMMGFGALGTSKNVVTGNTPSVDPGDCTIEFFALGAKTDTDSNISNYLANILLDFAFRNQVFAGPVSTYVALAITADIADSDTGSTINEPGDTYARQLVNPNSGASPVWTLASAGSVLNSDVINFPTPTGPWGAITATVVLDAATVGNVLFFDNAPVGEGQNPDDQDTVRFNASTLDNRLT